MAYTNIDDPSAHFQAFTYSGTSNTAASYTFTGNSNMKPDLVWLKQRGYSDSHYLFDSSRGVEKAIYSNLTNAEAFHNSSLTSFDTNGFSVGLSNVGSGGGTYATWNFKANGGTTSSNTEGNVTNTLQVNQDAGFSISKFTSILSGNTTIGHGLGVTPDVFIVKIASGTGGWWMNHKGLTNQSDRYVGLHSTQAETTFSWGAAPTSTLITAAPAFIGNGITTVICYAFAEKQGYSKFGSYVGNGNADGPFVYTGFKPAFVMIKPNVAGRNWQIIDNTRDPHNAMDRWLQPNLSASEFDGSTASVYMDFLSNGFKLRTDNVSWNQSGQTIIYMAFAENPFVTSTGIPTTAR